MLESFLKKNLNLKLLSLILSAFLWFAVHLMQSNLGITRTEESLKIPLSIENLSPSLRVMTAPSEVFISIKATQKGGEAIKPSEFKASVDLDGKKAGAFRNLPIHVASPVGYFVTQVNPSTAEIVIDEEADKTIPVTWQLEDDKEPGKISISPPEVVVQGAKSQVEQVTAAQVYITKDINFSNTVKEFTLVPIDNLSRPVIGPSTIPSNVRVMIERTNDLHPVAIRPFIIGKMAKNVELESVQVIPATVLVELSQSQNGLDHLDTFPVDITGTDSKYVKKIKLAVPPGVRIQGEKEVTVTVQMKKHS